MSRPPQELDVDALPVLLAFASGCTPRAAYFQLQKEWELDEAGFEVVVETLLEHNFLTPTKHSQTVPALASRGFASLLAHHRMLRDYVRVMSYRTAIARHCAGKVVVEIGCGSGILSIFAAQAGARRVIAIEESAIATLASRMFEANGCADLVELRLGNSRDIELDEPADLIVHEILGVDPFVENLLPYIHDARQRFLRPQGRLLPQRLEIYCQGLEVDESFSRGKARTLAEAQEFAGLYGVVFDPYLEVLAELPAQSFLRQTSVQTEEPFTPRVLSAPCRLFDLDLANLDLENGYLDREQRLSGNRLEIHTSGRLNAIVLYFRAHLDETIQLTTSPFAPLTSWGWNVRPVARARQVQGGDPVELEIELATWLGKQQLEVDLA